jgi:predicted N-acetyltransferase YhbS
MNIRSFQEADAPQAITLWTEVFAYPDPHNDPAESIRRKVAVKDDLFLVAVEDSKAVTTAIAGGSIPLRSIQLIEGKGSGPL